MLPYSKKGKRLGALILDSLIVSLITGVVVAVFSGNEIVSSGMAGGMLTGEMNGVMKIYSLASAIVNFLYFSLLENGKKHATFGKRAVGIKVVSASGDTVKALDVFVRNAIRVLPSLLSAVFADVAAISSLCGIANVVYYIIPLCNKQGRALHDFIAGTAVVTADYEAKKETIPAGGAAVINTWEYDNASTLQEKGAAGEAYSHTQTPQFANSERKLVGISGEYTGARFPLDEPLILGRMRNSCNVIFSENAKGVSRVHCKIAVDNGQVYVEDLGFFYGVRVIGCRQVSANERANLDVGNVIMIGRSETFKIE